MSNEQMLINLQAEKIETLEKELEALKKRYRIIFDRLLERNEQISRLEEELENQ